MSHRQDLAGVRTAGRVEGLAKTVLVVEIGRGEEFVHIGLLLDTDAVFARQHATRRKRGSEDLRTGGVDPFEGALFAGVEDEEGMQVPVACVKDIHHRDLVPIGDLVDLLEDVGESGPRNDGVVQVVVGRDLGDGAERGLAALPECKVGYRFTVILVGVVDFAGGVFVLCLEFTLLELGEASVVVVGADAEVY